MATLKDVAKLAAVSPSTASRILHGGTIKVSDETRERVVQAAEDLRYRANSLARSLRTRITRTIGFLLNDIRNPVYAQMIVGADEAAAEQGYSLLLMTAQDDDRRTGFLNLMAEDRTDGMVLADASLEDVWVERLVALGTPCVLVNRQAAPGAASVTLDDEAGAAMAIRYLVDQGHREIAYLSAPLRTDVGRRRLAGARRAMAENGIDLPDRRFYECGFAGEGAAAAVDRLLWNKEPITAIATGSVVIAMLALKALLQRGVSVPGQISVIGYHDNPFAQYVTPGISTVRMPLEELGRQAVLSVLRQVEGQPPQSVIVSEPVPVLVARQSVRMVRL